jgi:hypothetical protein
MEAALQENTRGSCHGRNLCARSIPIVVSGELAPKDTASLITEP